MYLKRIFHRDKLVRDDKGKVIDVKPGAVGGVIVKRADHGIQRMSPEAVNGGIEEGWISIAHGRLTIHNLGGDDVTYEILRTPGSTYCCHCEQRLDVGPNVEDDGLTGGQRHVRDAHGNAPSPDPSNPAGYRTEQFYTLLNGAAGGILAMSREEAIAYEQGVRHALQDKLRGKYKSLAQQLAERRAKKSGVAAAAVKLGLVLALGIWIDSLMQSFFAVPGVLLAGNFVFNIAKGRVAELYNRVDTNDPANAVLVILVLATSGIESDATLMDKDTVADLVSGTSNEVTNTNYARKILTDADLVAFAPDDVNDRVDLDIPDQTWTAIAAGDGWNDVVIAFDPDSTGGTDSALIPLTQHDFVVTPDGSDITAQVASAGFFRAS